MSCKQIDAMCLQETEIEYQFDTNLLAIDGYQLELESNDINARTPSNHISFEALHKLSKRATPEQMMRYKLSLCLYKLYSVPFNSKEFLRLNENQILTSQQTFFIAGRSNKLKIGLNCLSNRLSLLNKTIPLTWLNESLCTFKVKCKELMLL